MHIYVQRASRALLVAAIAVSSTACATITRGTKEDFAVQSEPAGAVVKTNHGYSCDTPCTMKLPRKSEFDITVSKTGYKPYTSRITNSMSGKGTAGLVGNVVVGGLIGIGVDAVSGATLDLHPNPLIVKLEAEGSADESRAVTPTVDVAPAATPAP